VAIAALGLLVAATLIVVDTFIVRRIRRQAARQPADTGNDATRDS